MVSLNTETDRTLFFDLLPMDVGMVSGFKTKLQLYTVPGQVFYNSTRKLVLKGVDGIVFVVDSQTPMLDACKESYQNLEENLRELGLNLDDIPTVFQWNKRDLRNVVPVDVLEAAFNPKGTPVSNPSPRMGQACSRPCGASPSWPFPTSRSMCWVRPTGCRPCAGASSLPKPPPPEVEALTLSDLPSVTDLLDMEGTTAPDLTVGSTPITDDDDDSGLFIEAPVLPEPPEAVEDDIAVLLESEPVLPPAEPETVDLVVSAMSGFDRAFEVEPIKASAEAVPH